MIGLDLNMPELLPKYQLLRKKILREIRSGHWVEGYRIPPERELIDLFGVSITTVRRCLNDLVHEGFLVRHRRRGTFVTALAETRMKQAYGILFDRMSITLLTPFLLRLVTRLESQLAESDAILRILSTKELEQTGSPGQAITEMAQLHGLDGLFLASPFNESWIKEMKASPDSLPLVSLQLDYSHMGIPSLMMDMKLVLEPAIRHLYDLEHRDIAVIFGKWEDQKGIPLATTHRVAIALQTIAANCQFKGCQIDFHTHPYFNRSKVEQLVAPLLKAGDRNPTAFIIQEESVAYLVQEMAFRTGLLVPRDISIVTLEPGSPYSSFTSAESQLDNLCWRAVRLMQQLTEGFCPRVLQEWLGADLLVRNSTTLAQRQPVKNK